MDIEESIFKKSNVIFDKLISYGFTENDNQYTYSKNILNDTFSVEIEVNFEGKVKGRVIELAFHEEYANYRVDDMKGEFVNTVRDEFKRILIDIKNHCFCEKYFMTGQANRLTDLIIGKYKDVPEFVWGKFPGHGVFRNPDSFKWYALIMNIHKNKLDKNADDEETEIINVKLSENKIHDLLSKNGFYKAYHMNKNNWISIILDDTVNDMEIMRYIEESHDFTENPDE